MADRGRKFTDEVPGVHRADTGGQVVAGPGGEAAHGVPLAAQVAGHPLGPVNPALYRLAAARARGIVDVTKGGNTVSFTQGGRQHTVSGFAAGPGYDLASGVGTVDARYFVSELASAVGH